MLFRRKKHTPPLYDKAGKVPVFRSRICTGESAGGFKDPFRGKSHWLVLIRDRDDLEEFLAQYQIDEGDIQREW